MPGLKKILKQAGVASAYTILNRSTKQLKLLHALSTAGIKQTPILSSSVLRSFVLTSNDLSWLLWLYFGKACDAGDKNNYHRLSIVGFLNT